MTRTSVDTRSVLARLRALPRTRTHRPGGLYSLAERQASLLRYLTADSGLPLEQTIAELSRLRVNYADIPTSGLSHWDGRQWVVTLNAREPDTRQRFTLLHEYKHIIDHPDAEVLYVDRPGVTAREQMEQAAEFFAGCALVPSPLLEDAWQDGITAPDDLARLFHVSVSAIKVRLTQLGLAADRYPSRTLPPTHEKKVSPSMKALA